MKRYSLLIISVLSFSYNSSAQSIIPEDYHKIFVPSVNVQANWTKGVKAETERYQQQNLNIRYSQPLFKQKRESAYTVVPSFVRLMLNVGANVTMRNYTAFSTQHYLIQPSVGLTGYYFRRMKNLFLLQATAFAGEDQFTITKPQIKWRGNFLYRRQFSTAFSAMAGVGYSYILGGGKLYPIVGVSGWANEKLYFQAIFPFLGQLSYYPSTWTRWSLILRPNGNINRFANKDNIAALPNVALWRQREVKMGVQGSFKTSRHVKWTVETGGLFLRKAIFSNVQKNFTKDNELASVKLPPSIYLQAGIQYYFEGKDKIQNPYFEFLED